MSMIREVEKNGRWHEVLVEGVIVLVPKDREASQVEDWRPITLLNVSYEIWAKFLANRMKS